MLHIQDMVMVCRCIANESLLLSLSLHHGALSDFVTLHKNAVILDTTPAVGPPHTLQCGVRWRVKVGALYFVGSLHGIGSRRDPTLLFIQLRGDLFSAMCYRQADSSERTLGTRDFSMLPNIS